MATETAANRTIAIIIARTSFGSLLISFIFLFFEQEIFGQTHHGEHGEHGEKKMKDYAPPLHPRDPRVPRGWSVFAVVTSLWRNWRRSGRRPSSLRGSGPRFHSILRVCPVVRAPPDRSSL